MGWQFGITMSATRIAFLRPSTASWGKPRRCGSDAGPWSTRDVLTGRWQLRRSKKESFDPVDTHTVPTMIGGIGGRAGAAIEE